MLTLPSWKLPKARGRMAAIGSTSENLELYIFIGGNPCGGPIATKLVELRM